MLGDKGFTPWPELGAELEGAGSSWAPCGWELAALVISVTSPTPTSGLWSGLRFTSWGGGFHLRVKKEVRVTCNSILDVSRMDPVTFSCPGGCLVGTGESSFLVLEERLIRTGVLLQHSFLLHPYCSHS